MQSVSFTRTLFEQPYNGQYVWLLREGETDPVPARYSSEGHRRAEFSLLGGDFSYGRGSAWAPMEIPENANKVSP